MGHFGNRWATLLTQLAILLAIGPFFAGTMGHFAGNMDHFAGTIDHLRPVNKEPHSHSILRIKIRIIFDHGTFQNFSNSVMSL
jgi:hypothetical protein